MSLQVKGAENMVMIFKPVYPTQFIVNIHHPDSTNIAGNQGDATRMFDLKDVVSPPCIKNDGHKKGHQHNKIKTGSESNDTNFVRKLIKAGK